jgi:hypothetical protein
MDYQMDYAEAEIRVMAWLVLLSEIDPINMNYKRKELNMKDLNLDIKVSTVGEDDRPDLEGKAVITIDAGYRDVACIVAGCNKSVGLTLIDANTKRNVLCVRGPILADNTLDGHIDYDKSWDYLVKSIEDGVLDLKEYNDLYKNKRGKAGSGFGGVVCAYSQ